MNIWDESQIICTWHFKSRESSLRKQPTFCNSTTGFPTKWCLRKDCRNSILMTRHYPDLGTRCMCFLIGWKFSSTIQKYYPDLPWHTLIISMEFLCSFCRAHFKGVTTNGAVKCYLKEVDNDQCYCATPSILDSKPFLEHPGLICPWPKTTP